MNNSNIYPHKYFPSSYNNDTLILIHGSMADDSFFDGLLPFFEDYNVIVINMNYYYQEIYDTDFNDCLCKISKRINASIKGILKGKVWIIGHSSGSLMAVEMAKAEKWFDGLILIEPAFALKKEDRILIEKWNKEINNYMNDSQLFKAMLTFLDFSGIEHTENQLDLLGLKSNVKKFKQYFDKEMNIVHNYKVTEEVIASLNIPVIIGVSSATNNNQFRSITLNDSMMSKTSIISLPGGHNGIADYPKQSADVIINILNNYVEGDV